MRWRETLDERKLSIFLVHLCRMLVISIAAAGCGVGRRKVEDS